MTDKQVLAIVTDGFPIAAVLLARGSWLRAAVEARITERFPAEDGQPAVWRIDLLGAMDEAYHSVYTTSDTIIGISCRRTPLNATV